MIISIRPVCKDDLFELMNIRNIETVKQFLRQIEYCTLEGQYKWFERLINDKNNYSFSILLNEKIIGACSIINIDHTQRHAEVGWFLNPKYHGKGYCKIAIQKMLFFIFEYLQLNTIYAYVYSDNIKGLKFANKIGFNKVGEFRKRRKRNNKDINEVIFDYTREEFYGN